MTDTGENCESATLRDCHVVIRWDWCIVILSNPVSLYPQFSAGVVLALFDFREYARCTVAPDPSSIKNSLYAAAAAAVVILTCHSMRRDDRPSSAFAVNI